MEEGIAARFDGACNICWTQSLDMFTGKKIPWFKTSMHLFFCSLDDTEIGINEPMSRLGRCKVL
jgi:hypothetical protein